MANYTATSGSYTTTLTVTQTSQDQTNNTSTLTYSLTLKKNAGTGLWNNNSCPWSITIDGTQVASGTFTYDFRSTTTLTLKSSTTTTVNHNNDGTKTVSVSASVNMNNPDYVSVMQPSGSLTLTTIPRASDISLSVSSFNITASSGNAFQYTITAQSSSFYNRLRYTLGNTSYTGGSSQGTRTGNFSNTELLNALPTATSGTLTAYVDTATDSAFTNIIGTKSTSITVSVNTNNIKPSISLGNIAINTSPISGYAVAGYSSVKSTATTTNSYGATSFTNYFTVSHGTLVSSSSTTASTTVKTNTVPTNASNYTLTIYAYAKDSRGAISSTVSKTITVYGYQPPTATLNAYRVASSSATTEDGAGTYAYVTFSGAVSSSVNSQNTIQSTVCTYSGSISGTASNGGHYALSDTQTVTFTLTVRDKVTSSTVQKSISTAKYPLDLYDNGSGSVGVGLGAIAEAGYVKNGLPLKLNENLILDIKGDIYNTWTIDGHTSQYRYAYIHNCSAIRSNSNTTYCYHRIATIQNITSSWYDISGIMILDQGYSGGAFGIARVVFRTDNITAGANASVEIKWLVRAGFATDTLQYGLVKTTGSASADIYYKETETYSSANIRWLGSNRGYTSDRWTLINSLAQGNGASGTNTTNTEVYTGVNRVSYTVTGTATENGYVNSAGSASSSVYSQRLETARTSTNANDLVVKNRTNMYEVQQGSSNLPTNAYYFVETMQGADTNYAVQLAIGETTSYMFMRRYDNSTWQSWFHIPIDIILWTGTLTAGNTVSIPAMANYDRIRVYAFTWGAQHNFEIAFTAQPNAGIVDSGYPYQSGTVVPMYSGASASGTMEYHGLMCKVSSDKKTFYFCSAGYWTNSVSWTARQNNSQYYVCKIEGLR